MTDVHASLPPRYLRTPEAARFLGLSGRTLEKHRTFGTGPAYRKIGGRVVYRVEDLQRWADQGLARLDLGPWRLPRSACRSRRAGSECRVRSRRFLEGVRPRDAIDLMAWPCFSLAKRPRHTPMVHEYRGDFMRVMPTPRQPGARDHLGRGYPDLGRVAVRRGRQSSACRLPGAHGARFSGSALSRPPDRAVPICPAQSRAGPSRRRRGGDKCGCPRKQGGQIPLGRALGADRRRSAPRPARMALRRRGRAPPNPAHRPRVFPADGWHRALAVAPAPPP